MLKSNHTTPSTLAKLVLALTLIVSTASCNSLKRNVEIVEHTTHDTLYINKVMYDSVYLCENQHTDRLHDTVYINKIQREYKYKFLRDTLRIVKTDSIPVIKEVEVIKTERHTPTWMKVTTAIGIIAVILILILVLLRIFYSKQ